MTVDVYAWPPVGETAFEISRVDPISTSTSLIDGQPRQSRYGRSRRVSTSVVSGIGPDAAGAGYMEELKYFLAGGINLVRVNVHSSIWHFLRASNNSSILQGNLTWLNSNSNIFWTSGGGGILWQESEGTPISGVPATDDIWDAITVSNLPPSTLVCRPNEVISIYSSDGSTKESTRAITVARSNSLGVATIRVRDTMLTSGPVVIGDTESIVFRALELPRAVQPQLGNWEYSWSFVEAFEDEYTGGFVEKNPW